MHRQGQFQIFDFCNLGSDLHVIKSANSRKDYPNTDTHVLNEQHVETCDVENFDAFYSRMRMVYYIDKDDDEWNCTCPYFCKYACYKHMVRFKKHVLGIAVDDKYDMAVLTPRAKRGRPKNKPRALVVMDHDAIVQYDEQATFSSDDESQGSIYNIVLDGYDVPAEV